jgi:hypothetical protein
MNWPRIILEKQWHSRKKPGEHFGLICLLT